MPALIIIIFHSRLKDCKRIFRFLEIWNCGYIFRHPPSESAPSLLESVQRRLYEEGNSILTIAARFSHTFPARNLVASRSIKIFSLKRTVGRRVIRIRADCKLSAKPPLIGLKSDHRDSVRRRSRLHLSFAQCIVEEGARGPRRCTLGGVVQQRVGPYVPTRMAP